MMDSDPLDAVRQRLEKCIPRPRYEHCVRVEQESRRLAQKFHANEDVCAMAGLLHDCARDLTEAELENMAPAAGVDPDVFVHPILLHGPVGALIARRDFGICDERVLSAITQHTAGGPDMDLEDKIVCLADYTEPGRSFPGVERLRELADESVDIALAEALEGTVRHLVDQGLDPDPVALACARALLDNIKESHKVGESTDS